MKFDNMLKNVTTAFAGVRLGGKKTDPELAALDRGILEVALMVSSLDGEILPSEYASFETLAKKCRGYTVRSARECLDRALRKAGFLMAMAQVGDYSEKDRVNEFVKLATEAMPAGFASGSMADLRRAFVLWVSMGVADGDFSGIERKAIGALASLCANGTLFEADFFARTEKLVRDLAVASKAAKAEAELKELINTVSVQTENGVEKRSAATIALKLAVLSTGVALFGLPAQAAGSTDSSFTDIQRGQRGMRGATIEWAQSSFTDIQRSQRGTRGATIDASMSRNQRGVNRRFDGTGRE